MSQTNFKEFNKMFEDFMDFVYNDKENIINKTWPETLKTLKNFEKTFNNLIEMFDLQEEEYDTFIVNILETKLYIKNEIKNLCKV